jgi:vacuolar-type H+-ATPase subunit E/Vma4
MQDAHELEGIQKRRDEEAEYIRENARASKLKALSESISQLQKVKELPPESMGVLPQIDDLTLA